ncbi:MAG: ATPase, T2SS/T4P/T4SS family [Desulfobacteraceae bacterium]
MIAPYKRGDSDVVEHRLAPVDVNTGHDGSLTTIHADSSRDALMRLDTMVVMANFDIRSEFLRRFIASAIHAVIRVDRLSDCRRMMVGVQEIAGVRGNVITIDYQRRRNFHAAAPPVSPTFLMETLFRL